MNLYYCITQMKNSFGISYSKTIVSNTKLNRHFLDILWDEGYIRGYQITSNKEILVWLKYNLSGSSIKKIKVLSKPSCRIYIKSKELWQIQRKELLTLIVFTSKGIITAQQACQQNLGGEVLCSIY